MLTSAQIEAVETEAIAMLKDPDCEVSRNALERFAVHCIAVRTCLIRVESKARLAASTPAKPATDKY